MKELLSWFGGAQQHPPADDNTLSRFVAGASIPRLSGEAFDIIARQREIEAEIRIYLADQDRYIGELEAQVNQLLAEREYYSRS